MSIYEKISAAQTEIGAIAKTSENKHFDHKYFDVSALLEVVHPALANQGLVVTQPIKQGVVWTIITEIETGDEITSELPLPTGVKAQDIGSAITYYRRYTLQSLLALPAEDDDGNKASGGNKNQNQNQDRSKNRSKAKASKKQDQAPTPPPRPTEAGQTAVDKARADAAKRMAALEADPVDVSALLADLKADPDAGRYFKEQVKLMAERGSTQSWSFRDGHVWTVAELDAARGFLRQLGPHAADIIGRVIGDIERGVIAADPLLVKYNSTLGLNAPIDVVEEIPVEHYGWLAAYPNNN